MMLKKITNFLLPAKGDTKSEIIRKGVIIAALLTLIVSMVTVGIYYINSWHNAALNKHLTDQYKKKPSSSSDRYPKGMLPNFYQLYDANHDIKGWITIPQTVVNYPVVQSADNSFYLNRSFHKLADDHGSLFLDYRDQVKTPSQNLIIYGHNMKDGQMFHSIVNYQMTSFYQKSSLITFNTIYGNDQWKVFAAFIANAEPKDGYVFNYLVTNFPTDTAMMNFIKEVRARSLINAPSVDVKPGDTLLTLSTCYYSLNNGRFVVMARRVRPGEDTVVPPATRNEGALPATSPLPD